MGFMVACLDSDQPRVHNETFSKKREERPSKSSSFKHCLQMESHLFKIFNITDTSFLYQVSPTFNTALTDILIKSKTPKFYFGTV